MQRYIAHNLTVWAVMGFIGGTTNSKYRHINKKFPAWKNRRLTLGTEISKDSMVMTWLLISQKIFFIWLIQQAICYYLEGPRTCLKKSYGPLKLICCVKNIA